SIRPTQTPICNNTLYLTFEVAIISSGGESSVKTLAPQERVDLIDFFPVRASPAIDSAREKFIIEVRCAGELIRRSLNLEKGFYVALLAPARGTDTPRVKFHVTKLVRQEIIEQLAVGLEPGNQQMHTVERCYEAFQSRCKKSAPPDYYESFFSNPDTVFSTMLCYHSELISEGDMAALESWGAYKKIVGLSPETRFYRFINLEHMIDSVADEM
ncbi:MAG: hypothetical protein KBC64_07705, partial [Simkaniaceae bacterium]|nr:hypothetical protein [Simkaniaceae bacterium]